MALLEENRGQSISGERMARLLGISRNAVLKAVNSLRNDGYDISAGTNRGYLFDESNDILSVQGITPFLSDAKMSDKVTVYQSLESTNKTAKEMALEGAEHGSVVIADCQTSGRGRRNRQFHSPPGSGIYMSFILHPEQNPFEAPTLITAFAAVAVCEAIEEVSTIKPRIKWVNDIYVDNKKVCGILTEAVTDFESGEIGWIVVGIGINFSTAENDFPEEIRKIAGSLFPNGKADITRNRLAAGLINKFMNFAAYGKEDMLEKYRSRLFILGKRIDVISAKENYKATAVDIDDMGRLIVRTDENEIRSLNSGEISVRI